MFSVQLAIENQTWTMETQNGVIILVFNFSNVNIVIFHHVLFAYLQHSSKYVWIDFIPQPINI